MRVDRSEPHPRMSGYLDVVKGVEVAALFFMPKMARKDGIYHEHEPREDKRGPCKD